MNTADQTPPAGALPESIEPGSPLYNLLLDVYMAAFTSGASSSLGSMIYSGSGGTLPSTAELDSINGVALRLAKSLFDRFDRDPVSRQSVQASFDSALRRAHAGEPSPFEGAAAPTISGHVEILDGPATAGGDPCQH